MAGEMVEFQSNGATTRGYLSITCDARPEFVSCVASANVAAGGQEHDKKCHGSAACTAEAGG